MRSKMGRARDAGRASCRAGHRRLPAGWPYPEAPLAAWNEMAKLFGDGWPAPPRLLPRLVEIPQIGRGLALLGGHELAVAAHEVGFLADEDILIALDADVLHPDRIALAVIAPRDGPGARQGVIDGRDLIPQDVRIGFVPVH